MGMNNANYIRTYVNYIMNFAYDCRCAADLAPTHPLDLISAKTI